MDDAAPESGDLHERGLHFSDREVRQRGRIARTGATLVDTKRRRPAMRLPAATLGPAALTELDAEQA